MAKKFDKPAELTAVQAKMEAQKIAFSAMTFEAAVCVIRLGILRAVADAGRHGISSGQLAKDLDISEYGVRVLLDMGLSMNLVWKNDDRYSLDKIGHFLLEDDMTQINMNFAQDVCYDAMSHLMTSIKNSAPEGLKVFGDWPTIYRGLPHLPEPAKSSWFAFNDFYSKSAFSQALPIVFTDRPSRMLDVGGHLGAWALQCIAYDPDVHITIADLPEQVVSAREVLARHDAGDRIDTYECDLLDPQMQFPDRVDAIWMSQLLDCFSEDQIAEILRRAASSMRAGDTLYILELFWNCQEYDVAAYSINATSLYFTCLANGVSRMYHSQDIIGLAEGAGLRLIAQHDGLGIGNTLLHLKKA
jgi:O-methyltransferase/methyltransferase family protein